MKTFKLLIKFSLLSVITSLAVGTQIAFAQQKPKPGTKPKVETLVDYIWVSKKTNSLYLIKNKQILHRYGVAFGANPIGHKTQEGDHRTPEGTYRIAEKRTYSKFYKALLISYPNAEDAKNARRNNVSPGGNIMVHGIPNDFAFLPEFIQDFQDWVNWTDGCIAVTNKEMDQIFSLIHVGIPIVITPKDRK